MIDRAGIKALLMRVPVIGQLVLKIKRTIVPTKEFRGSTSYWETRYLGGGNSGAGSYSRLALFKAEIINDFVSKNRVRSVIELGCGDGNQLKLAEYQQYTGFDVSQKAIENCRDMFAGDKTKKFAVLSTYNRESAELALSLDVIYHLVEDSIFEEHMKLLFESSRRYVIVYSSCDEALNSEETPKHVRHRNFLHCVAGNGSDWTLREKIVNRFPFDGKNSNDSSFADFYIFEKMETQR